MRKIFFGITALMLLAIGFSFVSAAEQNVCCEKTTSGMYCQDVPAAQCDPASKQAPTSCRSTSYCKPGVCYDSNEGTCLENTPQNVCNINNGVWNANPVSQCDLGCCVIGDQAAFVTLTRCKKLSSFLGLETNYQKNIKTESACVASVQNQDKGACVFDSELRRTCKFTTRGDCGTVFGGNKTGGQFYVGKLCSAPELATNCAPTTQTACVSGKEEVYFVDTCGNPANVYDASKAKDPEYWTNVKDKSQACNPTSGNAGSASCGNCNYLLGSFCRDSSKAGAKATYGSNICADLNCQRTSNGKSYKHGESWCVNDEAKTGTGDNSVGSAFFRHICLNGEEIIESCADFRQQECIEDKIDTSLGAFSQAACRVNRWQDCAAQTNALDCANTDKRDCLWMSSGESVKCVPKNSPGLKFWEDEETKAVCEQASAECEVTFEKNLFGQEKCVANCQCLDSGWANDQNVVCKALGDCGPKVNFVGSKGYGTSFKVKK